MRKLFSFFSVLLLLSVMSMESWAAAPTTQARFISFRNKAATSVDIRWSNGNGGRRLVIVEAGASITVDPVDGADYSASDNPDYTLAAQVGAGGYAVYDGTGRRVSVTGLSANTQYTVKVYEYNGTGAGTEYIVSDGTTANPRSFTTLYSAPATPGTITITASPTISDFTVSWVAASGTIDGYELDIAEDSGFSSYTAPFDDWQVADVGNNTSWYVDSMNVADAHYIRVRSYYGLNSSAWVNYGSNPVWTLDDEPAADGSCGTRSAYAQTSMTLDWTAPTGGADKYLVFMSTSTIPGPTAIANFDALDGAAVTAANSDYGVNSQGVPNAYTAGPPYLVGNTSSTSQAVTSLTAGTNYYFRIVPFNDGSGSDAATSNYEPTGFACGPYPTISSDLADVSGCATTSTYSSTTLSFEWDTDGSAENWLIFIKETSDFDGTDEAPADGTTYSITNYNPTGDPHTIAYGTFDSWATAYGSGSSTAKVIRYNGSDPDGSSMEHAYITGLSADTRYYIRIYGVNTDAAAGSENYNVPCNLNRWTLADVSTGGPASSVTTSIPDCATTTTVDVSWTAGTVTPSTDPARYLVVARLTANAQNNALVVNGTSYTANADWASAQQLSATHRVVYDGTGTSFTATGLTAGTGWSFDVYTYSSNNTSSYCSTCGSQDYSTLGPATGSITTPEVVPTDPTGVITATVTANSETTLNLSWPSVSGVAGYFIVAKAGASAPTSTPTCRTVYDYDLSGSTPSQFGAGYDLSGGSLEYVVGYYSQATTSATITSLTANTVYSFTLYTYNGDDYDASGASSPTEATFSTNYSTGSIYGSRTTLATATSCASTVAFSTQGVTTLDFDLTDCGAGSDNFIVLMSTSAISVAPVDGNSTYPTPTGATVAYGTAGNLFSTNVYVVYNGTASDQTIQVTGLSAETRYYIALFDYNGVSGAENYTPTASSTDNQWTLTTEPTQQAQFWTDNDVTFTNLGASQVTLNWQDLANDGPYYLVLAIQGNESIPTADPADGTYYTPNTVYGSATPLVLDTKNWYPVYNGTGQTVTITSMANEAQYTYLIYSYDWDGTNGVTSNYLTSTDPDWAQRYTLSSEPTTGITIAETARGTTTMDIGVTTTGSNDPEYVVVYARAGSAVSASPTDGSGQAVGDYSDWTGTAINSGDGINFIVAVLDYTSSGAGTKTVSMTNLDPDTHYYFSAWGFNALPTVPETYNYMSPAATDDAWTYATQPSNMANGDITLSNGSLIIDWSSYTGPATNYLVVAVSGNPGAAEGTDPTDGTAYTGANSDWSAPPTAYGTGFIVYNGSGTSVTVTNVDVARYYNVSIWPYNGSNALSYNYAAAEGTNGIWTWDADPGNPATFTVSPVTGSGSQLSLSDFTTSGTADEYIVLANTTTPSFPTLTNGTNLVDDLSADIALGTYNYTSAQTLNGSKVVYHGPSPSGALVLDGYSSCTTYNFTVLSYRNGTASSATGAPLDAVNNFNSTATSASGATNAVEPTTQPTTMTFTNKSTNTTASTRQYDVGWTAASGSPTGYIVVATEGASGAGATPADGSSYTANAQYNNGGAAIGTGYVVYSGTGTSFTFIAESSTKYAQDYTFEVYSYNTCGTASSMNYLQTSPLTDTDYILALLPTAQPSALTPSNHAYIQGTQCSGDISSMDLTWTGSSDKYMVIARLGSDPVQAPQNAVTYGASNTICGSSSTIGASDHFIVYTGSATTVNVQGLNPGGEYHYAVYSYNDNDVSPASVAGTENYKTPPIYGTRTALQKDPLIWDSPSADSIVAATVQQQQATVSWTAASKDCAGGGVSGYLVVVKDGATASAGTLTDGTTAYGSGAQAMYTNGLGGDGYVCYVGSATSFTLTGLNTLSQYTVRVYSYYDNGIAESINYSEGMTACGSNDEYLDVTFSTLANDPTGPPSALLFDAGRTSTTLPVSWTKHASAAYSIVIVQSVHDRDTDGWSFVQPVQGTSYSVGDNMNGGDQTQGFVGYVGTASSATITGLDPNTPYYVRVYGYNETGGVGQNYYPLSGTAYVEERHTTLVTSEPTSATGTAGANNGGSVAFSWTGGTATNTLLVIQSAGSPGAPTDGMTYGTSGTFSPGGTIVYNGSGTSATVTGLTPGNLYTAKLYGYNGSNYPDATENGASITDEGSEDYDATGTTFNFYALDTEPSAPTSCSFGTRTTSSIAISWSGSADNYLVMAYTLAITGTPTDGTTYTAGAQAYGSDNAFGNGQLVYNGSATSATVTGLSTNTPYYFAIFAYNDAGAGSENYNSTPTECDHTTLDTQPSGAPTSLATDATSTISLDISWTLGTGSSNTLILARESSAVADTPVDGMGYNANATYGSGGSIGTSYVVYNGTGTSFTLSGLNDGTTYYFSMWSFNGATYAPQSPEGAQNYFGTATHNATTDVAGATPDHLNLTGFPTQFYSGTSYNITVNLQDAAHASTTSASNIAFTVYAGSSSIGSGTITAGNSSATSSISYTAASGENDVAFTATWSGQPGTADTHTQDVIAAAPTNQASGLTLTAMSGTTMRIQWTVGSGNSGTAIYCRQISAVDVTPTDGQTTAPDLSYNYSGSTGTQPSQLIYAGNNGDTTVTNLRAGRTLYYFQLFDYIGVATDGTANFNTTSAPTGSQRTNRSKIATPGDPNSMSNVGFEVGLVSPNPANNNSMYFNLQSYDEMAFTIEIYSVDGELVRTLKANDIMTVGTHDIVVDLKNIANGTYVLQVVADNEAAIQKFVIAK